MKQRFPECWVPPDDVVALSKAILLLFQINAANRQKSRLMYLIDKLGIEKFLKR